MKFLEGYVVVVLSEKISIYFFAEVTQNRDWSRAPDKSARQKTDKHYTWSEKYTTTFEAIAKSKFVVSIANLGS